VGVLQPVHFLVRFSSCSVVVCEFVLVHDFDSRSCHYDCHVHKFVLVHNFDSRSCHGDCHIRFDLFSRFVHTIARSQYFVLV